MARLREVLCAALAVLVVATPAASQPDRTELLRTLDLAGYPRGERAPAFATRTFDGRPLSLTSLRGRVVLLTFWATWCQPCRDEMRLFERLHRDLGGAGLVVVGVNSREDVTPIVDYARALELTFPLAVDPDGKVGGAYGVVGLPTTFVIGRDGRAVARAVGARDWGSDSARTLVRALLAEASTPR